MKFTNIVALLVVLMSLNVFAEEMFLYTDKGYPYKNLVDKADQIHLYYQTAEETWGMSGQQEVVRCRVEVNWQGNVSKTEPAKVSVSQFEKSPLASCLPRSVAKQYLADIRNSAISAIE